MNFRRSQIAVCFVAVAAIFLAATAYLGILGANARTAAGSSGYHLAKTIPVGGDPGWDYVTVESANRRVYVSHGTHVVVLDADTQATVGDIPDTQGVHGIAIAGDQGRGFVSNGRANTVTVFDLRTLKTISTV